jgi:hypothetical protein
MKDLGALHYFLGIQVHWTTEGFFLHQQQYAEDILDRVGTLNCRPASTPVDTKAKVSTAAGLPLKDPTYNRSIAGALQYLTLTMPELAHAVQQACLHMHDPRDAHWNIIKRILWYVRGTSGHGVVLRASSSTALTAYTDTDWAVCPDTRRSM